MKKSIARFILLFSGWMISLGATGQSLEEFVNTALANNYQVRILKNNTSIASNNNTAGKAGALPTVDLSGGFTTSLNNTRQEFADGSVREGNNARTSNMNLSLLANWTAFQGFAVYARRDRFTYLEEQGQLNSKFYIEQTVADIATAYAQLTYEIRMQRAFEQTLTISRYRLNLEEKRREVGAGTAMQYNQALADYRSDSIAILERDNRIKSLEIEINRILCVDPETTLTPTDSVIGSGFTLEKEALLQQLREQSYALQTNKLTELIAEADLRLEKAMRAPKIDLFAGYQLGQNTAQVGFFELNRNYGPTMGVTVNFNLFNGGKTSTAIENRMLMQQNTSLQTQETQQNLESETLKLYYQYESLQNIIKLAEENVTTMQAVYNSAREQLEKGAINAYDFRVVQLSLLQAKTTLLQHQFTLQLTEINLHRVSGNVLNAYL